MDSPRSSSALWPMAVTRPIPLAVRMVFPRGLGGLILKTRTSVQIDGSPFGDGIEVFWWSALSLTRWASSSFRPERDWTERAESTRRRLGEGGNNALDLCSAPPVLVNAVGLGAAGFVFDAVLVCEADFVVLGRPGSAELGEAKPVGLESRNAAGLCASYSDWLGKIGRVRKPAIAPTITIVATSEIPQPRAAQGHLIVPRNTALSAVIRANSLNCATGIAICPAEAASPPRNGSTNQRSGAR